MGARKQTLGYASRTEAVLALRGQRLSTRAIADRLGIEPKTVAALEHSAFRSRRSRAPDQRAELCRTVLFAVDVLDRLGPHAAKRNIHPNSLARLIVETVVDDDMIDAVLDDAADLAGWA